MGAGRRARALLTAASLVAVVCTLMAGEPATAGQPCTGADCSVVADPDDAQYVGSGGLLLPADSFTGSSADRSDAATCSDCRWALLPMCRGDGQAGDVACGGAAASCPPGQFRRIVLLLRPGDTEWQEVGLVCLVDGVPTTVDDIASRLGDLVVEDVPPLDPSWQPHGGTLIGLPAVFAAGQPRALGERTFSLVGFAIVLRGRAAWTWDFGDGTSVTTDDPGGQWPDLGVSHTYRHAGSYRVAVSTTWDAWFTVDGMGPWPVSGPALVQTAVPPAVQVSEARAELIMG